MVDVNILGLCQVTREFIKVDLRRWCLPFFLSLFLFFFFLPPSPTRCLRCASQIISDLNIHGQVINVSSIAGHRIPGTTSVFYSATKHAVRVITEGLRMEVGRHPFIHLPIHTFA